VLIEENLIEIGARLEHTAGSPSDALHKKSGFENRQFQTATQIGVWCSVSMHRAIGIIFLRAQVI
jgi:hypothetical protein